MTDERQDATLCLKLVAANDEKVLLPINASK